MRKTRGRNPPLGPDAQPRPSAHDLRAILEEIGICTWSLNPKTGRVTVSGNCRRVLGVPSSVLADHDTFQSLVHPDDRAARANAVRGALERGGHYGIEYRLCDGDGGTRWVRSHGRAALGADGHPVRFRGVVYCIDEHRQAESRLQALQTDLLHVSRLSAMGEMASALAHELNQPLGAISNYTAVCDHLLAGTDDPRIQAAREALARAVEQTQRAGAIIRRLREFVTRGETERRVESVAALISDACALALVDAREQGVEIRVDPGFPGTCVLADRVQVQQVLVNLIRNACEAMRGAPRRELTVTARAPRAGETHFTVADTGPGIPVEIEETLFLPFVTTKPDGMGVGLSVSRSIVLAHGGHFWSGSVPGGGAAFHFTLPTFED